jgi:phosphatidylserine/phosphatidylglycerophosphate/cardiolipin synthase-like enzyme
MRAGISLLRALVVSAVLIAVPTMSSAGEVEIHHAPTENLERVDVGLIGSALETIDLAAFVLTDRAVIDALIAAQARGVAIRIVLDPSQRSDVTRLQPLAEEVRVKRKGPLMHLKSYLVDGRTLRTGSANFTASGLKQQDNDLLVIHDAGAVASFAASFERIWDRGVPISDASVRSE